MAAARIMTALPAVVLGVAAAAIGIAVLPGIRDLYQLPKLFALTYGAAAAALAYATFAPAGWYRRWPRAFALSLLAMAACVAIGVAIAPLQTGGGLGLAARSDGYRWMAGLVIAAVAALAVDRPGRLRLVLGGMTVGGLYVALIGIGQHHGIDSLLPADEKLWVGINRPGSAFGNRNMAAQWMLVTLPAAAAALGLAWADWRAKKRALAVATAAIGVTALAIEGYYLRLTVTRAAWAGLGAGCGAAGLAMAIAKWRGSAAHAAERLGRPAQVAAAGIGLALVLAVMLGGVLRAPSYDSGHGDRKRQASVKELVATGFDFQRKDWQRRKVMWTATANAIVDRPWGHGAGNWRVLYPRYITKRERNPHFSIDTQPTRAHQDVLQVAAEYGVQGLLALLAWLSVTALLAIRAMTPRRPEGSEPAEGDALQPDPTVAVAVSIAGVVAIVAIVVDGLFSFPLQLPAPLFGLCLWTGLVAAQHASHGDENARRSPGAGQWVLVIAAVIGLGFVHVENGRLLRGDRLLTEANQALGRGKPKRAVELMEQAVSLHPGNFENHFLLGLGALRSGDPVRAVEATEEALRWYPTLLNAWVNLAMFNARAGRNDAMNAAIDRTLQFKPDALHALTLRADWHAHRGEHDKVVATLWPQHDNPTLDGTWTGRANMRLHHALAKALEKTGRWADAAKTWEVMITRYPLWDYTSGKKAGSAYWQRKARKQESTKSVLIPRFSRSAGDAWSLAGEPCKALPNYRRVAESRGTHAAADKRRYAISLLHCGPWPRARHELMVALRAAPQLKAFYISQVWHRRLDPRGYPVAELDALINTMLRWEPIEALRRYDRQREERLRQKQLPQAQPNEEQIL